MTGKLAALIADHIRRRGPMDIAQFMDLALAHPEYGYYRTRDPLGARGDFTTAPEISQLFGEMIGLCLADFWQRMGAPSKFVLAEVGPGRGTLMADMLRAAKVLEGFIPAAHIHMIETSPALQAKQAQALAGYQPIWHDSLETLPDDCPLLLVGNEFLDALPIHQLQMTEEGWRERVVDLSGDQLVFGLRHLNFAPPSIQAKPGEVFEVSPVRIAFAQELARRIKAQGGAALLIDYGPAQSGIGDTLQAVKAHEYTPVLEDIGNADLTSHVDFAAIREGVSNIVSVSGPVEQRAFLERLGIQQRAAILMKNASVQQRADIESALKRLCDPDQMGSLFKVIGFTHDQNLQPAGF